MIEDLSQLRGRSMRRDDTVDLHRWRAYHRFFALDPQVDRPLAFHWLLFNELVSAVRPDGHPAVMEPFPELPFPRRMWAGGEIVWTRQLALYADVARRSVVNRAELKTGSSGSFLLTSLEHVIEVNGDLKIQERQDVVFLPADSRAGGGPARQAPFEAEWVLPRGSSTVELFRYSALTLNSHRIHYDEPYARTEGHRALVVHGPLLASQLMHAAARRRPTEMPSRFSYRSVAPVYVDELYQLAGRRSATGEELMVLGPDNGLRVTASMVFAGSEQPASS